MNIEAKNVSDPIPALDRATAVAVNLYDKVAQGDDQAMRSKLLVLLAHLRAARISAS